MKICMLMGRLISPGLSLCQRELAFVWMAQAAQVGPGTKDPRIRKCAWAFVVLVGPPEAPEIVGSTVGNLVGDKQSVPKAELTALVKALRPPVVS